MSKRQPYGNVKMKGKLEKPLRCGCCVAVNGKKAYSEKYDAYYCTKCVEWLEEKCNDRTCEYCIDRPEKNIAPDSAGTFLR